MNRIALRIRRWPTTLRTGSSPASCDSETLPSARYLAQEYSVSLGTARHATQLPRDRGLVQTIKSKGTYVMWKPDQEVGEPGREMA
ncbi:GntR family transcriptional regulator [Amycolatopsis cynarae]|uniref:GntR family transcriptional regulator n=1 Tax=Amycolatopsis cynarae TaxID=2995223 RepID=UPI003898F9C3